MRLLDDHALSQLDDCELEGLLERLLIRVFGQLVHVAVRPACPFASAELALDLMESTRGVVSP
jgi:hypothetical protein